MRAVFWIVTPCSSEEVRPFEGTYHLHLQGRKTNEQTSRSRQKVVNSPKNILFIDLTARTSYSMFSLQKCMHFSSSCVLHVPFVSRCLIRSPRYIQKKYKYTFFQSPLNFSLCMSLFNPNILSAPLSNLFAKCPTVTQTVISVMRSFCSRGRDLPDVTVLIYHCDISDIGINSAFGSPLTWAIMACVPRTKGSYSRNINHSQTNW
jgi:hypothetical protein